MSVRMKSTRAKTGARRSHHRALVPRLSACSNCKMPHRRHTMCAACGFYRGKQVVDVAKTSKKKLARASEKKAIADGRLPEKKSSK